MLVRTADLPRKRANATPCLYDARLIRRFNIDTKLHIRWMVHVECKQITESCKAYRFQPGTLACCMRKEGYLTSAGTRASASNFARRTGTPAKSNLAAA